MNTTIFNVFFFLWSLGYVVCLPYAFYLIYTGRWFQPHYKPPTWLTTCMLLSVVGLVGSLIMASFMVA